jgi:MFS family permease
MPRYRRVLCAADFRRIWLGSTISTIGDGMTFVALSWLVLAGPGGAVRIGLLAVCYNAPVVLGGLAAGPILDRLDKRTVLLVDCVFRACLMASIPITAALNALPGYLPFVAAAAYGLLKMLPLAGFPAAIPILVPESDLDAANALESLSFSLATVIGPGTAGVLIALVGAPNVLAIDSASFLVFALTLTRVRRSLRVPRRPTPTPKTRTATSLRTLVRDRVIIATTIAFMAFNIAEGMLLVAAPWLAKTTLTGGATTLGVLLALTATGEIIGAALAGGIRTQRSPIRAIGTVQTLSALGFLTLLAASNPIVIGAGFLLVGLLSAPMTVWAQSLRMRRIPAELHGRAFALLRTLMQGTLPLGSLLVTPFVANGRIGLAAIVMTLIAGLPGLTLLTAQRRSRRDTGGVAVGKAAEHVRPDRDPYTSPTARDRTGST